jgi:succinate dehydrogenase flavin-adding protein (antitoxin of CptAB toxin-antitoxin module)
MVVFHPLFAVIPMVIVFAAMGTMFQTTFSEGEPFSLHSNAVSAVETKMVFGVSGCEHQSPTVAILGKIQNDSPVSWEDVKIEATFFDEDGTLIDATQKEKYSFMVASKDASTFKLSFKREFPEEQYDSFKVRIISAKDEKKRF